MFETAVSLVATWRCEQFEYTRQKKGNTCFEASQMPRLVETRSN